MNHSEFVEKYNSGSIIVSVDADKAGFMYNLADIPKELKTKQALLRVFSFGGIILGITLFFYTHWWIALPILLIVLSMFPKLKNIAVNDVLQSSINNSSVYQIAIENQVLKMSPKMNEEEINKIDTKGRELLNSIEENLKDKEIGHIIEFNQFDGNYIHYHYFFEPFRNFRNLDDETFMFTINLEEMAIGVKVKKAESFNQIHIKAERL